MKFIPSVGLKNVHLWHCSPLRKMQALMMLGQFEDNLYEMVSLFEAGSPSTLDYTDGFAPCWRKAARVVRSERWPLHAGRGT
jgi:hypothetical protein